MRMVQKVKRMLVHDPRRPARYSLVPKDVTAYRWLGQEVPEICRKEGCFGLGSLKEAHIHTGPYTFKQVGYGDWVCRETEEGKLWVAGDTWFVENYRPGE